MAVRYGEFVLLNTEVLAVVVDSVYNHKVWNDVELSKMAGAPIPYPMLSDPNGNIGRLYDVYDVQKGASLRGTFIIDPDGFIHGAEVLTSPVGRSASEILRKLKAFQNYVSTGQLAPSNWQPGGPTLTESIDLAGQVWKVWKPK